MTLTLPDLIPMAKRKDATTPPERPAGRRQTTVRVYSGTSDKLNQLAILRKKAVHDLIDELFTDLLDHELILATETRLADLKKRQHGK